jgi:hypothetical protein
MPAGAVLSIRGVRPTTRTAAGGATEAVIGVRGALGAFGGVSSKFPALGTGSGSGCFVATADAAGRSARDLALRAALATARALTRSLHDEFRVGYGSQ